MRLCCRICILTYVIVGPETCRYKKLERITVHFMFKHIYFNSVEIKFLCERSKSSN